jgi:hypothetical protein
MRTTRIGSVYSVVRPGVRPGDIPESFAQAQQVLAARLKSDAHVAFAVALVGAIVFAQRLGHGAQVGQEPAQDLRAGDGHAGAKRAMPARSTHQP